MEVKEQFVKVGILYNAFDSSDIHKSELLYQEHNTLADYLVGLPDTVEWRVGVNGTPVKPEDYALTEVLPDDVLTIVMVPEGGGAKDILRMVAMVALIVAAVYFFGPGVGVFAAALGTAGTAAAMAVVMIAGSLLINALLPPTVPKNDMEQGTNYGYDGAKNTAREGVSIPVVYGNFRVAGNYVDLFTENHGNDQYLYGRTVLSDGIIDSVTNIELNEQPIANFQNVQSGYTVGNNTEAENTYFGRSMAAQSKGSVLTTTNTLHTTTTDVDAVQFNISFPAGLVQFTDKGKKKYQSVGIEYGYKLVGAPSFTTGTQVFSGMDTKTLRRTIEVGLPRGTYELYVRRTSVDSTDTKVYDDAVLTEIVEIQSSNVAMRSVATGWYKIKMTDQLSGVPRITWQVKGVKVNQYDASGTLVTKAWSNNPAWIVLDMLIGDERGAFQNNIGIDYQAFFDWATYCDTNGFLFNGVFDETASLWDCLAKVYQIGRAMPIRIGTTLSVAVDKPSTPVMMFGAGNIEKDTFKISYLPLTDRANEFEVSYYDKDDNNKKKTIRIIDPDAEGRGEMPRAAQYELIGVDNHDQAEKEVWYQLYQNRLVKKTVTFRAPIESIGLTLGDVALIQHDMVDWGISGRIAQGISTTQVKLDKAVTVGDGDTLMVIFDSVGAETDVIEERTVASIDTVNNIVTVTTPFSQVPQDLHNYMFGQSASVARPFRLRSISGDDLHSRELMFVEYNDFIYSAPEQVIPASGPRTSFNITGQVQNLSFVDAVDYADTKEKDVIATVGWTVGNIRKFAGVDVYLGTIAKEDYDLGTTTPEYKLYETLYNVRDTKVVAEYGDYIFVKIVAFDINGIRANFNSAPSIYALVEDPIVLPDPTIISDGSAFAYTTSTGSAEMSFEFQYTGLMADINGFYVDVQWSDTAAFTTSTTERFILDPTQRAIILGNIDPGAYYRFSVASYKLVHDIFNPDGLVTSNFINAFEYPYNPGATTVYAGDIMDSITTANPFVDFLDFIHYNPSVTVEEPALATLSRPVASIPTDESGGSAYLNDTGTTISVAQGGTALAYNGLGTTAGTWRVVSTTATNCTAGAITDTGTDAAVAPLSAITGGTTTTTASLLFTLAGKTLGGADFTLKVTQAFTKLIGAIVDTAPPSVPTGLALTSFVTTDAVSGVPKTTLRATWTASPETDTAGYILALQEGTGNFVEYKLGKDVSFQLPVLANVSYSAKIKSYDQRNNVSAFSTVVSHTSAKDSVAPAAPTGLAASAAFKNIFLQWTNPADSDIETIKIYEHTTNVPTAAYVLDTVVGTPSTSGSYTRAGLTNGATMYYWVSAVDTSGNESPKSAIASATTASIANTDITDATLSATKFASTIKPVEIVSALPTTDNAEGRMVYLTTDDKLYRYDGSAFISTVPTTDLTGQITTTQITDNSITTPKVVAGSITGNKLALLPNGNTINADPAIQDITLWGISSGCILSTDSDFVGSKAWESNSSQTYISANTEMQPFDPRKVYRASIVGKSFGAGRPAYLMVMFYDENKNPISTGGSGAWGGIGSWHYWGLVNTTPPTTATKYAITFSATAGQEATAPSNARYMRLGSYIAYGGGGVPANYNRMGSFLLQEVTPAELIVDGAITTDKLAANSITAGKIQAGAIGADQIAANSITTSKLILAPGNLISNGDFATGTFAEWRIYAGASYASIVDISGGGLAKYAAQLAHPGSGTVATGIFSDTVNYEMAGARDSGFAVEGGKEYRVSLNVLQSGGFVGGFRVFLFYVTNTGTTDTSSQVITLNQTNIEASSWYNSLQSGSVTIPVNASRAWVYVLADGWTAGTVTFTNVKVTQKASTDLIVDGAITTQKMTANSISGDRIAAGTLNADKIVAGSITGDRFNTGTSLPGTITVGSTGVKIETVRAQAENSGSLVWVNTNAGYYEAQGNKVISLAASTWASSMYTQESYSGACSVKFKLDVYGTFGGMTTLDNIFAGASYANITYSIHRSTNGSWYIYNGGGQVLVLGTSYNGVAFSANTLFQITNDGVKINYYADNVLMYQQTTITGTNKMCAIVSMSVIGASVSALAFTPYSDNSLALADPAARVNAYSTTIDPGKILISGSTTLSNWRNGGDNTKIEGGSIAANTISANKVSIGVRGITIEGLEFEANRQYPAGSVVNNWLAWGNGTITYVNDAGATTSVAISNSYVQWTSGVVYVYWQKGVAGIYTTTSAATANSPDNIVLATYRGGTDLVVTYGRTIIDGTKITTGTIDATRLNVTSLSAITANIGLLRTASTGARTEIENNVIRVYDSTGTLRVRLGIW